MIFRSRPTRRPAGLALAAAALLLGMAALVAPACGRTVVAPPQVAPPVAFRPPLADAQVGERLVLRRGATQWHYTVVQAGHVEILVEVVMYENGAPQAAPSTYKFHRNGFGVQPLDVVRSVEQARLLVGGRDWDCWLLVVDNSERGQWYYWISSEVGAHGVLKIARSDGGAPEEASAITWQSDSVSGLEARDEER